MVDLTVIILTKNEEKNLRKFIESFRGVAKRFVIVDSYSTDGTEKLCTELNNERIEFSKWLDIMAMRKIISIVRARKNLLL